MMAIYVDKSEHGLGRMKMCHMVADTPDELLAMATHIGVSIRWFQADSSTPHFDVCKSKRKLAIEAGALEADRRLFVEIIRRIRRTWPRVNGRWVLLTVQLNWH